MEKTRFAQGLEKLREIDGTGGEAVMGALLDIAPDLGRYIVEFAFGEIYIRKELDIQTREQITLASLLTAGGCEPQLKVHIAAALRVGVTPEQIVETFLQCVPYTDFPKELNAVFTAKRVFAKLEISPR